MSNRKIFTQQDAKETSIDYVFTTMTSFYQRRKKQGHQGSHQALNGCQATGQPPLGLDTVRQAQGTRGPGNSAAAQASTQGPDPASAVHAPTSTEEHAYRVARLREKPISEHVMEAIEEEEPPQPAVLDVELSSDTPGNRKETGTPMTWPFFISMMLMTWTRVPKSLQEVLLGLGHCLFLPDPAGEMEGGDAGNMHEGLEAASESVILILLGH